MPTFLAMALAWSSFTDTGTETLAIEESGGERVDVLINVLWSPVCWIPPPHGFKIRLHT